VQQLILGPSFDDKIFLPSSMIVSKDQSSLGIVFQILIRQIDFETFLMVAMRIIILVIFMSAATYSTMVIRALGSQQRDVDQAVRLLFPDIPVCGTLADGD
jgi:hypothetical protein